ncbi:myosin head (motor domain) domain-containing protein [Ditylenchus destructor]|nr:myosin head (motor domain) domain-containing protein [Ditylenchus destructor]
MIFENTENDNNSLVLGAPGFLRRESEGGSEEETDAEVELQSDLYQFDERKGLKNNVDEHWEEVYRILDIPTEIAEKETTSLEHNLIWVPDKEMAYRMGHLLEENTSKFTTDKKKKETVTVGFRDDNDVYEKRNVDKETIQSVSLSHYCADMCNLTELNEASILCTIRSRYELRLIHTYSGLFCVVVNPWQAVPLYTQTVIDFYMSQCKVNNALPPHVYCVAQQAYEGILHGTNAKSFSSVNQSILITGESGAGKTENTKKIIEYLICAAGKRSREVGITRGPQKSDLDSVILSAGVALEAFSNAKTVHNDNSSRLGKFIRIDFDRNGLLSSARIDCYLLEKTRVVYQNEGGRNFHIFYQIFANGFCDAQQRMALGLSKLPAQYRFLNQGGASSIEGIDDWTNGRATQSALELLDFSQTERSWILHCIAACILIGEIRFAIDDVAKIIGVNSSKLIEALTQPSIRIGDSTIRKNQGLKKTLSSSLSLAKVIYERLFRWIVGKCNAIIERHNKSIEGPTSFVGVLDMAGFEIISHNSFEQFCINFTNEKLQQFFNQFLFIKEKAEYVNEGIEWNEADYGNDLQHTIDMIESPMGFLSLLQEECIVPNGNDTSLLDKLIRTLSNSHGGVFAKAKYSTRNTSINHFTVIHYAGQVSYNIDGWVEKNRDLVDQSILDVLSASDHPLIAQLFTPVQPSSEMTRSRRGSLATSTVSCVYKEQLSNLLQTLNSTKAQFIRCIVPNYERKPFALNGPCNGVLEGIRICRRGYPNRVPFADFLHRYKILASLHPDYVQFEKRTCDGHHATTLVSSLCRLLKIDETRYKIGRTKIFCRVGLISELESRRKVHINGSVSRLQAWIRWYIQQQIVQRKHVAWENTLLIQRAVRRCAQLSKWEWYRAWLKVRQLIPLVMDKKRLTELETENADLIKANKTMKSELSVLEEKQQLFKRKQRQLEDEREEEHQRVVELKLELKRNEDLLELMEKKFDEQHSKIMRLNSTLTENSKMLERLEEEKRDMQTELDSIQKKHKEEYEARILAEESLSITAKESHQLRAKLDSLHEEYQRLNEKFHLAEHQVDEWQDKHRTQEDTINTLQHSIADLNEKFNKCECALHDERASRRRREEELDQMEEEVGRLKEELEKADIRKEAVKEQIRAKDNTIRKLERKLDDKTAEMEDCVAELKKIHKASQNQLQNQLEELEMENKQQKCKLESAAQSFERESSVDSDFGRTATLSRYGSRHSVGGGGSSSIMSTSTLSMGGSFYSSTSMAHRSLGSRRRETEPELMGMRSFDQSSTNLHRSPSNHSTTSSTSRLSRHHTLGQMTTSMTNTFDSGLARSSSTSSSSNILALQASERKISQLEKELHSTKTDMQLVKREIEVYKIALQDAERTKDTLGKQIRSVNGEIERLTHALESAEQQLQHANFDVRKWTNECDVWKQRLEESIAESKSECMTERKKHAEKLESLRHDYEMRLHHVTNSQKSNEQLQERLAEAELQLDKAIAQIAQMERMNKSQTTIGETWESQYRSILQEMESLRDENAALKSKIRRQYKQIELLTQQEEIGQHVTELESKVNKLQDRQQSATQLHFSTEGHSENITSPSTSVTLVMRSDSIADCHHDDEEDKEEMDQSVTLCTIIYN